MVIYQMLIRLCLAHQSDHNVIHLLPMYKAKLKQEKPTVREVALWSDVCKERLRDCYDDTNWDIFFDNCVNADKITETITSYIIFYENNVVPTKTVEIYPNNKVWVSHKMKKCLREKRAAFAQGNMVHFKDKRPELRAIIRKSRQQYKDKVEKQFVTGDARKACSSLNNMMGRERHKQHSQPINTGLSANELNPFYSKFDKTTHKVRVDQECCQVWNTITLTEQEVAGCLARVNPHKAPGPDGLRGRAIAGCIYQFKGVFTRFQIFA